MCQARPGSAGVSTDGPGTSGSQGRANAEAGPSTQAAAASAKLQYTVAQRMKEAGMAITSVMNPMLYTSQPYFAWCTCMARAAKTSKWLVWQDRAHLMVTRLSSTLLTSSPACHG